MPSFGKKIINKFLLCRFKMNCPVNLEIYFSYILVFKYVCLSSIALKIVCSFCSKICDSIRNYFHHGKNHSSLEV